MDEAEGKPSARQSRRAMPPTNVRNLPANAFAVAMATGIVAEAVNDLGMRLPAQMIFGVAVAAYAMLWGMLLTRFARYPSDARKDFGSHARAPGFFAVVAATCLIGSVTTVGPWAACLLWILGLVLWFALTYVMLPGLMILEAKPTLRTGLNGGWLLAVVATESLAVLGCRVASATPGATGRAEMFVALCFWFVGGMLYFWLIGLIVYRCFFVRMRASDLTPAYWINMGAMSIATLAGVLLVRQSATFPQLLRIQPFIDGFTLLFWATATWWIPMLLALGTWRHVMQRYPLRYDADNWSAVFPLGMYAVATHGLADTLQLQFINWIAVAFAWIALVAWLGTCATFVLAEISRRDERTPELHA